MIIGISGTHGTGKSTIVNALSNWVQIDESQISRNAQKALGWEKLSIAGESVENMKALQEAILAAMYDRDSKLVNNKDFIITERTPADVWAYTVMWCKRLGIDYTQDDWAKNYFGRCNEMANKYSAFIVVPINNDIPFVVDPNRADLVSREMVADIIDLFLDAHGEKVNHVFATGKNERASECLDIFHNITFKHEKEQDSHD